ncbi:MAG: hypothetical protein KGL39_23600 [Patescibacteria group bacterium]|nr:hypothetical protein [Patescibacteria group bacterium]
MSIPGANLLNMALRLVAKQTFQYMPYVSRTLQGNGVYLSTYGQSRVISGSVQAIPRNLYQQYGLDFQRNYVNFFVPQGIIDIGRNVAGDKIIYQNVTYECLSNTNWKAQDGWTSVLAIQVIS